MRGDMEHARNTGAIRTALLLMACFVLAQADKQVMGLLAIPVQRTFALNDTQLGFLQGGAFAIAFALGGLPIAHFLDRGHRLRIAGVCVAAWSLATILCGLAPSFTLLILFRAATAFAEAGLPPAAFSIFSQNKEPRMIARFTGAFMLAPFVGGGGVLLLGGFFLGLVGDAGITIWGLAEGWRMIFVLIGLLGLVIAPALAIYGHEPDRPPKTNGDIAAPGLITVMRVIFRTRPFLRFYYLGLTSFYIFSAALIGWYPSLLVRNLGLEPGEAGAYAGITYLVSGIAGTLAATARAGLSRSTDTAGIVGFYLIVLGILVPTSLILPLTEQLGWSLLMYGAYAFLSAAVTATMTVPIQLSLPNDIQARGLAILSLLMSAFAGSIGPLIVGALNDQTPLSLAQSLGLTGLASASVSLIFLAAAWRNLRD